MRIRLSRRCGLPTATATALLALAPVAGILAPTPVYAAPPVQALLYRPINPAPSGADAIRLSIFGDKSGATVRVRLLAKGQTGVLTGYYVSPAVPVDFEGWKTVSLPLSDFKYASDTNPGTTQDGLSDSGSLLQSNGLVVEINAGAAKIFLAELGWASGTTESAEIDLFDTTPQNKLRPVGDFHKARSIATVASNQGGKKALQVVVRDHALVERQNHKAAIDNALKARPQTPYYVFTRPLFDPIHAETVPSPTDIKGGIAITIPVCRDEEEPASIGVYTTKALPGATIKIGSPFTTAAKQTLPASAINIRVVRPSKIANGPYLLLKDDREVLTGASPVVRLTGDPITDIAAETCKQFWVSVRIPRNQAPGLYKGRLVFSATGVQPTPIPVTVQVLNLPLKTAFLQYGIDLRSLISPGESVPGAVTVTAEELEAQLENIRDHGVRLVTLYETGGDLQTGVALYKKLALSLAGPIVVGGASDSTGVSEAEGLRTAVGLDRGFELYYRAPSALVSSGLGTFQSAVASVNRKALVVAEVESKSMYRSLSEAIGDTRGERLAPLYPVSSDYAQELLQTGKRTTFNRDYWTWNIPAQSMVMNRLLAGFIVYKTGPGFYGAFPGPYQYVPSGVDPYIAFSDDAMTATELPQMTVFPVKGGVLDTLQWEAVREGIDDIRYIGVLKGIIRELKDAKKGAEQVKVAETMLAGLVNRDLTTLQPQQATNFRAVIVREAVKLQALLGRK